MDVFWFLPTHGDGHYLGTTQGARPVTDDKLRQELLDAVKGAK